LRYEGRYLIAFFLICTTVIATLYWKTNMSEQRHMREVSFENARFYTETIRKIRQVYSDRVSKIAARARIPVTGNRDELEHGAIPIPILFTQLVGQALGEVDGAVSFTIVSALDMKTKQAKSGTFGTYESEAWQALSIELRKSFHRVESGQENPYIRYTVPDIMSESCINCHNQILNSTAKKWEVGDVAALITVTMPLSDIAVDLHEEFNSEFALTLLVYFLIVAAIALLIFRSKKVTDNLMSEVESKTDTLKNEIAYRQKAELEHRRSEAMLSQILNTALDAIITVDIRGKIVKVNAASTVLFGYSNEELIGQAVEILMPTSFADMHQKILDKYVVTGNANVIGKTGRQLLGKRKNGELFPMFISVGEFEMEGERYFTSIIHDLTEMVAYQTELEHAKEVAERANQAKSIFLSSISHEVRTPLNAILGFAQLMQMDAQKYPLSEDQESAIKEIENAGNHLLAIITDLLDYSTYEVGNIALIKEDTNLFDLVNESLTIVSRMAVEKNVHLFATDALKNMGISVEVDRRRIKQVLINLLSNAIKYNRQGGTVDVECNYDEPNTAAKITIRDTGLGIAEDKLEHIYEPFNRVGAERSDIEGTGIGLAIVSRIVQKHDGIIEIDSTVGEGTTFVITLPNARKQILDTGTR